MVHPGREWAFVLRAGSAVPAGACESHCRGLAAVLKVKSQMAEWTASVAVKDRRPAPEAEPDPLGFLAGRRYTCYCGRSVVGTMLCDSCADEMVRYFLRVARQTNNGS
jgi:hypothetical protein